MTFATLFCLPYAGGSQYSYQGYCSYAPDGLQVVPVELPGRGARYAEPLLTDICLMVDDVFGRLKDQLYEPYALYGHSMGALLVYLLSRRIVAEKLPPPRHLFCTGCRGPSARETGAPWHLLPDNEFVAKLKGLGGSPDELLENEDLMRFFVPILKADLQAVETYRHVPSDPLDIPISVWIGCDENVTVQEARAWQQETTGPFEMGQMPGKHFFIFDYEEEIMARVARWRACVPT
jgi:surfactin synthase thioesterase subunit